MSNHYFKAVYMRPNFVTAFFTGVLYAIASPFRLMLEVFIKIKMGPRYFSFSSAAFFLVATSLIPVFITMASHRGHIHWGFFSLHCLSWYVFVAAGLRAAWQRRKEISRDTRFVDFTLFSLSPGLTNPFFYKVRLFGKKPDIKTVETLIEPGCFFLVGLGLAMLGQFVGGFIMLAAIFYSISYFGAYQIAYNEIMDKIDKIIVQEELAKMIIDGLDRSDTRGVPYMGPRPADEEMGRKIVDSILEHEEEEAVR